MTFTLLSTRLSRLVLVIVAACALATSARAQTVLFDFGNDDSYRGLSVPDPDPNGNYWNSLRTGVFYQDLVDINNSSTAIDFGFSTGVATDSYNGPAGPTTAATLLDDVQFTDIDSGALGNLGGPLEAAFDFIAGGPGAVRFELQELNLAKSYNLTFFGSHAYSVDDTTVYSIYTDNTYTTLIDSVSLSIQDAELPQLHNRDTVVTLNNVSPQADSIIYIEFIGANGAEGYLNAMQLEAVVTVGDFNSDGLVDAADYTVWRDNENGDESVLGGAGDGSGTVDAGDYSLWVSNYGAGGSVPVAVPEPTSVVLMMSVILGLSISRKRSS